MMGEQCQMTHLNQHFCASLLLFEQVGYFHVGRLSMLKGVFILAYVYRLCNR